MKKVFALLILFVLLCIATSVIVIELNGNVMPPEILPDNAVAILEQNSPLLNQAADILLDTPEAFLSVREDGESYSQLSVEEILTDASIQYYFSTDEIQLLRNVVFSTQLFSVGMYYPMYGRAQAVCFSFRCSDQNENSLCYVRPTITEPEYTDTQQIQELLDYMTYDWVEYRPTGFPYWYSEIRSDQLWRNTR